MKNQTQTTKEKELDKETKSQLRRKKIQQTGGVRIPIPRPGGPMKDKKKYNRRARRK